MRRPRPIWLLAAAVSFLAFLGFSALLAQRLVQHQRERGREVFAFQPVEQTSFTYAGRDASLRDETTEEGREIVVVEYGDRTLELVPSVPPGHPDLPFYVRHQDWLGLFRFAPRSGMTHQEFIDAMNSGEVADRLVLVIRKLQPGANPDTFGEVWRKNWSFELYEFLPEGAFDVDRLRYPTAKRGEPPKPGELAPGTWQYDAALLVMPKHGAPSPSFIDDAMQSAGWTLPAAALSMLAVVATLAIAFAPPRTAPPSNPPTSDRPGSA